MIQEEDIIHFISQEEIKVLSRRFSTDKILHDDLQKMVENHKYIINHENQT